MTYAFTQDVPIDAAFYDRIAKEIGTELPPGLVCHLVVERPEGGLRYIDVWETEADWDTFVEGRLHPVVHGLLAEIFGEHLPPEPERTPLALHHVWSR